jgi:hypothetical protein
MLRLQPSTEVKFDEKNKQALRGVSDIFLADNTKPASRPRILAQIYILTRRGLTNNWRDYGQTAGFAIQVLSIAVCTGLAFYKPPETPSGIQAC